MKQNNKTEKRGMKIIIKCEYNAFDILKNMMSESRPRTLTTSDGYMLMVWDNFRWSLKNSNTLIILNILNVLDVINKENPREKGFRYSFVSIGNAFQTCECRYNDTDLGLSAALAMGSIR